MENFSFMRIDVLKNQYSRNLRKEIFVTNTDAFDAIMYYIACRSADDSDFAEIWKKKADKMLVKYIETNLKFGARMQTYTSRTNILKEYFALENNVLQCDWPMKRVAETFFLKYMPSVFASRPECVAECENWKAEKPFFNMNDEIAQRTCPVCNSNIQEVLSRCLCVDGVEQYQNANISFEILKKVIEINGLNYTLNGLIEVKDSGTSRFFVAHILRQNVWYTFDCRNDNPIQEKFKTPMNVQLLLYSTATIATHEKVCL